MGGDAKTSIISTAIGLRIKKLRETRFVSAVACAEKYGVKPPNWTKIEQGKTRFSAEDIYKLSEFFRVTPVWLLTGLEPIDDILGLNWDKMTRDTPRALATWPIEPLRDKFEAVSIGESISEALSSPNSQHGSGVPSIYDLPMLPPPTSNRAEKQEDASEAKAANAPTPVSALPPGNAIRRKGDQDAAHRVLYLKAVGNAAALEKGASHRGGFDDESLYWDSTEEIPESTHLVRIRGDSMAPLMMHGQSVMVGTQYRPEIGEVPRERELVIAEVTVQNNDIGGVDNQWEGVHCKRIQDGGDFWLFTSINPSGATFSVAKDNCRLWHVIGVYFGEKSRIPEED